MKFDIRFTTKDDYPELVTWWKWHRWSKPPSIELLDNLKFGIMISQNGVNICAGFIYFTNARAFGIIEFIVSNPKIKDREIRKESQEFLIVSLTELAIKKGMTSIITFVKSTHLITKLANCGFVESAKGYSSMVYNE